MSIKNVLLVIQSVEEAERLTHAAAIIARQHDAHLTALHVAETVIMISEATYLPVTVQDHMTKVQNENANLISAAFAKIADPEDFGSEFRFERIIGTVASDHIIEQARTADLVIMAQQDPAANETSREITLERTIRKSGRPVLVIPFAGRFETFGTNAIIGWSPTREATRAAHDAIDLIGPGNKAQILTVRSEASRSKGFSSAQELALTFDRHGIIAEVADREMDGVAVGDVLLNEAFEKGADLIVTGAFGHSRIYDFVIGATTTALLRNMTVPVLFSS